MIFLSWQQEIHMKRLVKRIIKNTPLYHPLRNRVVRRKDAKEFIEWEMNGKPVPPPHIVKQKTLQTYSIKYSLKILVETGTLYGDMVEAMKEVFEHIYSIELDELLYEEAKKRFKAAEHIELICGDSGVEIINLMNKIDEPALFWLDAHYSGGVTAKGENDTPIYKELTTIFNAPDRGHVIIIDDARSFGSDPGYPNMDELIDFVNSKRSNLEIAVQDDSIRITPKQ